MPGEILFKKYTISPGIWNAPQLLNVARPNKKVYIDNIALIRREAVSSTRKVERHLTRLTVSARKRSRTALPLGGNRKAYLHIRCCGQ